MELMDLGTGEVGRRSLRLVDESDPSLLVRRPGASSSSMDTYPGRSLEGAKIPYQEVPEWCISVKLLSMKMAFDPVPPGL